jgi:prepilin-type N-terminal cleavage/methylation domain-containing protein
MDNKTSRRGFTLIEVITVLVLIGIMAAMAGQGIVTATQGFVFARSNAETAGKSQMAMSRIIREFTEIMDVSIANADGISYTRLDGPHSLALVSGGVRMLDDAALPTAGAGHVLIDQVSGFNLQYFKGDAVWVPGTDNVNLLSAITVDLTMTRPDGISQTFSTMVTPRNNGNVGGAPPPSSSNVPPAYSNVCFINAAAAETSTSGLWPAWPALLLLAGLLWNGTRNRKALKMSRSTRRTSSSQPGRPGAILICIIVTIVLMSVLGAAMLSMTTTSTMREVSSNLSSQAYYLAESGYRYAATEYQNTPNVDGDDTPENADDKNAVQQNLSDHGPYSVAANQVFDLTIQPYYFVTASGHAVGDTVIRTFRPGQEPTDQTIPNTGSIRIQKKVYDYTAYSNGNFTLALALAPGDPLVAANSDYLDVLPVGYTSGATSLSEGGNLSLANAGFFPDRNGTFTITREADHPGDLGSYAYETKSGNILQNITVVQNPTNPTAQTLPLSLTTDDQVALDAFVRLISVGTAGSGANQVSRQIIYRAPIGRNPTAAGSSEKETFVDTFENLDHWHPSVFPVNGHEIVNVDGNSALHVRDTWDWGSWHSLKVSLIALNWGPGYADFNTAWYNNNKYLSYDVQAKIRAFQEDFYMAGINIRTNLPSPSFESLRGLGVALMRNSDGSTLYWDWDGIPDGVTPPAQNTPLVTLWQKTDAGLSWLAYRELDNSDFDIAPPYFFDDMESGATKWTATGPWALVTSSYHSSNHAWHDSPGGNYAPNLGSSSNVSITTNTIDVSGATALDLVFWHSYSIEPRSFLGTWYDWGAVEYSKDGGDWTLFQRYAGTQSWTKASLDLSSLLPANTLRIRFRMRTDSSDNRDGWYIDDVSMERLYAPNFDTLLVRLQEKTADTNPFNTQRVNDIRVYIGDTTTHGTPDGDLTDAQRHSNLRWTQGGDPVALGEVVWPQEDPADWDVDHDHFTLVQNWIVNTNYTSNVQVTGTEDEPSAILRLNINTTNPDASYFNQQEVSLHTFGNSSTSVYFDDFAVQLAGMASSSSRGYRSPIQE